MNYANMYKQTSAVVPYVCEWKGDAGDAHNYEGEKQRRC